MKKIWDTQNNVPLYAINEQALHQRIQVKKKKAHHITHISELLGIVVNAGGGCGMLVLNLFKSSTNMFLYVLSAWMILSGLYMIKGRMRRIKAASRFDHSLRGDLEHALAIATYQVRISQFGRWNIFLVSFLVFLALRVEGTSVWFIAGLVVFLLIVSFAGSWEHGIYKARKRELEVLRSKLEPEMPVDTSS